MSPRLDRIVIVAADPLRNRAAGMSVQHLLEVSPGRDVEIGPVPLNEVDLGTYAGQWNAGLVVERDQLLDDKATLTIQVTTLTSERDLAREQLRSQTDALASVTADRDGLVIDKQSLQSQLATAEATMVSQAFQIEQLQAELDALLNPPVNPRHLAPFDFLALLKPTEVYALQTSSDPMVVVARAKLQTIITYVDLDHPDTIALAQYMESQGLLEAGRAAQILAGESPTA